MKASHICLIFIAPLFLSTVVFRSALSLQCYLFLILHFTLKKYLPLPTTVIHLSLLQLVGCQWMGEQLEVCLPKGGLFSRSLSPGHPAVSIFIPISPHSFLSPLASHVLFFNCRAREHQETGFLQNNIHMGDLNQPKKNNNNHKSQICSFLFFKNITSFQENRAELYVVFS